MGHPPKPPEPRAKIASGVLLVDEPDYRVPLDAGKPRPAAPKPLDEVERALSILDGRHPDAVRVERETQAVLARKKAAEDAHTRADRAGQRRRRVVRVGLALLIAAPFVAGVTAYRRRSALASAVAASLAPALASYVARGFVPIAPSRSRLFLEDSVDLETSESTCFVALASRAPGDGALVVERPSGRLEGEDSVAWCTCGTETATAHLRDMASGVAGLAVLRASAAELGGPDGLVLQDLKPRVLASPRDCDGAAFDAWIDAEVKQASAVHASDEALDEELRAALHRSGFAPAAAASPPRPFAAVPVPADSCVLATSSSPHDVLGLRLRGGGRPLDGVKGPLAYCARRAGNLTVWRAGPGELVVERVAAARIGGAHGVALAMPRFGLPSVTARVADDDLAWDAAATLQATGVLPAEMTPVADGRPTKDARVVALSIAGAMVLNDAPHGPAGGPGNASFACDPPLAPATRSCLCVQATELPWRTVGTVGSAGIVEGPLPFWMGGTAGATDARGLEMELRALSLGQRLMTEGFEVTLHDGVTEVDGGVRVHGRGGSDGLVAIQVSRDAPWVSTCRGASGEPWAVSGDPGVVSLAPTAEGDLVCAPHAAREHRTVVFRRTIAKPAPR